MKKPPLHVLAGNAPVGSLTRSDVEFDGFLFAYRQGTAADGAVSLTMPVRADQYDSMGGLLPLFEMNLPEGALRERLRLQFAKAVPEFDDLDLLQIVGKSQIGRLRYSVHEGFSEQVPAQDLGEILTYTGSADLFAHLLDRFAQYSGVSGVQPKVLVRDGTVPDKLTHRGTTHIVKAFDPSQYPELAANEYICTMGAAAAGIRVPRLQLSENRQFLIVDRFDLAADGTYLGLEDFCVLDARRSHGRYDGSYEQVARRITDYVSPGALTSAREQFALMVAYSCAIGNGDAHRKNFSVIYRTPADEVSLAPAYDIVSTVPYIPRDTLALELGGTKAFPDRARLLRFIRELTGSKARSAELLEQAVAGVATAIREAEEYGRRHADAAAFVDRITAVFRTGTERVVD
ncbi:MAG: type II toxin-antitoxin system HipA family toxin [Steroidobacteraceae bacterium]|nr:type II toxin-antitoxin system HipA family toxin [Steroidobacteraceae bacterium]MCC7198015.1 type II toxin-antitoxin system HipA family toxin [Gammaproteobacteria bacterium]